MSLTKKIDFALIIGVQNANPNGDPLNGNRPRVDVSGKGEMTDVCLKRKIRDRLQDSGDAIFVQANERKDDGMVSLKNRYDTFLKQLPEVTDEAQEEKKSKKGAEVKKDEIAKQACKKWLDVRSFGQVFAFSGKDESGVSIAVRGPVTVHSAFSIEPIIITSTQITKSVNGDGDSDVKKSSDTMGMKHRIDKGIYVAYGAMSPQLAERTGFSDDDAEKIKAVLSKLFEGDASSARPEGSMQVLKLIWWEHNCKSGQYSSAKVHGSLSVNADGSYVLNNLDGLKPEEIDGF
ncbi:type I-C CRISPR-associated protein Cas7/Csd2 [Testudinibacter sp. TR-2022]|uniref:type I-C CRISPR-associated protein Cas7/Csd2 n=1 Tax=Testudinibacter sp. TR-2022 TaxID=2585029 RepID=UPI00111A92B3|nr:type I-C CRISPR-associated protein Cas7/Csd2 [Testudinibacter sp. TR-2022]TNH03948.1 type I-C CRISPR-associated protein Cas7/Csd2 [Pasteurellaceae bacterium Phil31]TNH09561.1 type I-C CRISPR-associated protein Cas7/Csd2 [Testudinibacter sp. TR-2022]TNH10081.1 type I-C CRISPR-associated protein Cas7/Csd2 [Testudinibacter sp. TR-2022]TNH17271.1 type I-C CRISPR-associated protein Cas7/Csd2 [Testudinibacter sp. TR-2022]TNH17351.1 type I-C CRISPR-associated protein Cas7/Csd2 [Testudinibacter sp.